MAPKFALFTKGSKLPVNKGFKNMFQLLYSLALNPRFVACFFFFFFFCFFFFCCFFNTPRIGKTFICKVKKLNVKQCRSWWDGSLWAVSSGYMLFVKVYYHRLWQWKSLTVANSACRPYCDCFIVFCLSFHLVLGAWCGSDCICFSYQKELGVHESKKREISKVASLVKNGCVVS